MIKKLNVNNSNIRICLNATGNGGGWLKCGITNQNCPHQHWCTNKRVYEQVDSAVKCKDFKKKID